MATELGLFQPLSQELLDQIYGYVLDSAEIGCHVSFKSAPGLVIPWMSFNSGTLKNVSNLSMASNTMRDSYGQQPHDVERIRKNLHFTLILDHSVESFDCILPFKHLDAGIQALPFYHLHIYVEIQIPKGPFHADVSEQENDALLKERAKKFATVVSMVVETFPAARTIDVEVKTPSKMAQLTELERAAFTLCVNATLIDKARQPAIAPGSSKKVCVPDEAGVLTHKGSNQLLAGLLLDYKRAAKSGRVVAVLLPLTQGSLERNAKAIELRENQQMAAKAGGFLADICADLEKRQARNRRRKLEEKDRKREAEERKREREAKEEKTRGLCAHARVLQERVARIESRLPQARNKDTALNYSKPDLEGVNPSGTMTAHNQGRLLSTPDLEGLAATRTKTTPAQNTMALMQSNTKHDRHALGARRTIKWPDGVHAKNGLGGGKSSNGKDGDLIDRVAARPPRSRHQEGQRQA
ncbi:uncharacterized protein LTR77_001955 [Saxophila tyrrhenica]|uniref:Uncharacterized protein n=1 Tax=Saxophila tyrrhenica TaxID=1690608 RepID=A0AAV9PI55_9PEZI|nr:hypothetical protein LTR77_001955 [Saxophila tyrrhenica]